MDTEIYQQIRSLLVHLCGIDLNLLDREGNPVILSKSKLTNSLNDQELASSKICQHCSARIQDCFNSQPNIIEHVIEHREPKVFLCAGEFRKIIVPIVIDNDVAGFLLTGETESFRLNGLQIKSIIMLLEKITEYVFKNELKQFTEFKGNKLTHQQRLIKKVTDYIKQNYHSSDLSLYDISKRNGISYHYLSRLFKKELNTTFGQYRNKVRLNVASRLLKDRRLTVSQISYSCGYEDPGYFCKVFKENFGSSPIDFRKRQVLDTATEIGKRVEICES